MRFSLSGKVYDAKSLDHVSLKDILLFEQESEQAGRRMTWADVEQMTERIQALPAKDRKRSPDALWLMAVTIWATRRTAGETVTFDEAISFPIGELQILPDTQDHKAKSPKRRARPASAPGEDQAEETACGSSSAPKSKAASTSA